MPALRPRSRRDRELKLALNARRGASEDWIVDWRRRTVDVYRRGGDQLHPVATPTGEESLTSPLLPGFSCPLADLWPAKLHHR